jgi:hypothetical protein
MQKKSETEKSGCALVDPENVVFQKPPRLIELLEVKAQSSDTARECVEKLTFALNFRQNSEDGGLPHDNNEVAVDNVLELPSLKEDQEFVQFVKDNLWENRRDRGLPYRMNILDFIEDTYSEWIKKGMLQSDLYGVDDAAYNAMRVKLSKSKDTTFKLPTKHEGVIAATDDPHEKEMILKAREVDRYRRIARQNRLSQ